MVDFGLGKALTLWFQAVILQPDWFKPGTWAFFYNTPVVLIPSILGRRVSEYLSGGDHWT